MIELLVFIVVVGVLLWAVETYIPMSPPLRTILRVVVVVLVVLVVLSAFGLLPLRDFPVPRLH